MWKQLLKRFESTESLVSLALGIAVVFIVGVVSYNYISKKQQSPDGSTQKNSTQQEQKKLPTSYTVTEGDTLWSIAEKYYTSGYNWVDIQKSNDLTNPDRIEVGQTLTIPDVPPITPAQGQISAASFVPEAEKKTYTVVKGDTLWGISQQRYGTGYRWGDIALANSLANPNLIHSGNVLNLP